MKCMLFVVLAFVILTSIAGCLPNTCETYAENKHLLKAVVLDSGLEGSVGGTVFLMSGYLKSEHTFSFYEVTADGASHLRQIPAASALVYEDVTSEAWVEKKYSNYQCSPEEIRGPKMCDGIGDFVEDSTCKWYEIHIPVGSIVQLIDVQIDS